MVAAAVPDAHAAGHALEHRRKLDPHIGELEGRRDGRHRKGRLRVEGIPRAAIELVVAAVEEVPPRRLDVAQRRHAWHFVGAVWRVGPGEGRRDFRLPIHTYIWLPPAAAGS